MDITLRAARRCKTLPSSFNKACTGMVLSCSEHPGDVFTCEARQLLEVLVAGAALVNSGVFERSSAVAEKRVSSILKVMPCPAQDRSNSCEPSRRASLRGIIPELPCSSQKSRGHRPFFSGPRASLLARPAFSEDDQEKDLNSKQLATLKPLLEALTEEWETDALALADLTGNKPLSVLAMHLFEHHDLHSIFNMDIKKLERFLIAIENGYPVTNQYHNRAHAASVLHFMHSVLSHGGVAKAAAPAAAKVEGEERQQKLIILAGLLAAIVHDYEHEGLNNDFLVKTASEKALRYNDRSPNENHHVAAAWLVLQRPECNFLDNLGKEEARILRSLVVDLVLSTDMAEHGQLLKKFKEVSSVAAEPDASNACFKPASAQEALLALQLSLKCSDLGHLALCWSSHLRWVCLLEEEFFSQGDLEAKEGMPEISFLMDRNKPGASETQVGFFDFVVLPLFQALVSSFPAAQPMLSGVNNNYQKWKQVKAESDALASKK